MYRHASSTSRKRIADKWFHGVAPRSHVEETVKNAGINGSFAVRISETIAGAYTLSVLHYGQIHTYRVLPTPCGNLAVQTRDGIYKRKYLTIDELVHDYTKENNGIVCALTNPVGQSDGLSLYDKAVD